MFKNGSKYPTLNSDSTDIAPYVSALPPVRAKPVEQGSVVSAAMSKPVNVVAALVVAISLYIL